MVLFVISLLEVNKQDDHRVIMDVSIGGCCGRPKSNHRIGCKQ